MVDAVLDDTGTKFITRRESQSEPPNYYLHNGAKVTALTAFKDPSPQLRRITKQLVTYKRADGVAALDGALSARRLQARHAPSGRDVGLSARI